MKALKIGVASRARAGTGGSKLKKGKKRKGEGEAEGEPSAIEKTKQISAPQQDASWGIFEPVHGILSPFVDAVSPLISSNAVIVFLLVLLLIGWFRGPKNRDAEHRVGYARMPSPARMAAYEEIWRTQENELWKWLEERMDMQDVSYPAPTGRESPSKRQARRGRHLQSQGFKAKLAEEAMNEREIDHAIRVTEEKLEVLKAAVQKKKRPKQGDIPEQAQASSGEETTSQD